jgi:HD-like signal output (HDOD) protein/signal transduction histidine kinase
LDTDVKNSPTIFARLKRSRALPTLPQVLLKLIEACNDESCTTQRLSQIVFKDPSISSKVLQLVNSAQLGLGKKVTSLDKAIMYLGADTVKNVAISASVIQIFSKTQGNGAFNLPLFWWHSLMCASLSKAIAEEMAYPSPLEAFLSGLLHDLGKLVLWANFREEYGAILEEAGNNPLKILAGETALGAAHHEVGSWLARQWQLNSFLADAIFYHHNPADQVAEALPLVRIIYAANIMSRRREEITGEAAAEAGKLVGIELSKLEGLSRKAETETQEVARSFGITVTTLESPEARHPEAEKVAREALLTEVKNASLVYGTLQSLLGAASREAILQTAEQGLSILFGVQKIFFFLYDEQKNALLGHSVPGNNDSQIIDKQMILLTGSKSIFARSLSNNTPTTAFFPTGTRPSSIGEEQILRQLGTEGMICIPLRIHGNPLGLIIIGVLEPEATIILHQKKLLDLYISNVGMCLEANNIKQTQAQLIQEERINASARLSRKVVHEVNNPLGIIRNYLKILSLKLPEKHPAQTELDIIGEEIDRVGHIIRQLNDFSQPRPATREPIDVNMLLSTMLQLLKDPLLRPANIEAYFELDQHVPTFISDKNSLKQVIINLVKNAVEAMTDGGQLHIATKFIPAFGDDPSVADGKLPGNLEITIRDTGPGIPEAIEKRLFEPFVSSKNQGRGLGLSIVHGIIKELNGTITCRSKIGTGTTFTITLPGIAGRVD